MSDPATATEAALALEYTAIRHSLQGNGQAHTADFEHETIELLVKLLHSHTPTPAGVREASCILLKVQEACKAVLKEDAVLGKLFNQSGTSAAGQSASGYGHYQSLPVSTGNPHRSRQRNSDVNRPSMPDSRQNYSLKPPASAFSQAARVAASSSASPAGAANQPPAASKGGSFMQVALSRILPFHKRRSVSEQDAGSEPPSSPSYANSQPPASSASPSLLPATFMDISLDDASSNDGSFSLNRPLGSPAAGLDAFTSAAPMSAATLPYARAGTAAGVGFESFGSAAPYMGSQPSSLVGSPQVSVGPSLMSAGHSPMADTRLDTDHRDGLAVLALVRDASGMQDRACMLSMQQLLSSCGRASQAISASVGPGPWHEFKVQVRRPAARISF